MFGIDVAPFSSWLLLNILVLSIYSLSWLSFCSLIVVARFGRRLLSLLIPAFS